MSKRDNNGIFRARVGRIMQTKARIIGVAALILAGCEGGGYDRGKALINDASLLGPGRPLRTEVQEAEWKYPYGTGVVLTTRHYRIFASTKNRSLLRILPGFLEAAHEQYQQIAQLQPQSNYKRLAVYVLTSREEWTNLTKYVFGPDVPHHSISAGGYSHKGIGVYWDLRHRSTLSVAAHEGLHQLLYHRMRHRLPMWLEEGLCVSMEGFHIRKADVVFTPRHNPNRYQALRTAIVQQRWIPIHRLLHMDAANVVTGATERALGWYSQLWALALFLQNHPVHRDGLMRLLNDAEVGRFHRAVNVSLPALEELQRRGRVYNQTMGRVLFEHYITRDLESFEREYYAFARKLANLPAPPVRNND